MLPPTVAALVFLGSYWVLFALASCIVSRRVLHIHQDLTKKVPYIVMSFVVMLSFLVSLT